jgi:hypothetical protein
MKSGCWWEPAFWREPPYLAQSAWDVEVLDRSFDVLRQLIRAEETRAACAWVNIDDPVERERALAHPMSRDLVVLWPLSGLVRLALDSADADVLAHPELVRKLRGPRPGDFRGARFELRCLAAFRNARVDVTFDPLPLAAPGKKPDFLLRLPQRLFVDAKHVEAGAGVKEEGGWFERIAFDWESGIIADVRLTDRFRELQCMADGRSWLNQNIDRLVIDVRRAKERLANSAGPFPAVEIVEGLVRVEVSGPVGSATQGMVLGVETDTHKEAQRIVRGAINRAARQVPPGEVGAAILQAGWQVPAPIIMDQLVRWFDGEGEGAEYPQFVGALIVEETFPEPRPLITGRVERLIPVWRRNAPRWVLDGPWAAVSHAFALRDIEALAKRCVDADASLAAGPLAKP